jgi:hypothetical protein
MSGRVYSRDMTTTETRIPANVYPQYRMLTSKLGVCHGALAVKDTQSALRTFKGLQAAGIVDQAAVYGPGDSVEPVAYFGKR